MAENIKKIPIPKYSKTEEKINTISHELGVYFGVAGLYFLVLKSIFMGSSKWSFPISLVYGLSMVCLFSCSSIYHWLGVGFGKKVMRILDHNTVLLAIGGIFTPYLMTKIYEHDPKEATNLMLFLWATVALGMIMNFVSMERLKMVVYGICIILSFVIMFSIIHYAHWFPKSCILFAIMGGIFISIGAIMFNIGSRHKWFHSIFHMFVLVSCAFFYVSIFFYLI